MDRTRLSSPPDRLLAGVAAAALLALSACGEARQLVGLEKDAPDEFAVVTRAPLTLPPEYSLRPPRPGADRPQEASVVEQTRQTVFGVDDRGAAGGAASGTDGAFLERAGAGEAEPDIRRTVDLETGLLVGADETFLDELLDWRDAPAVGTVVDAQGEAQRLRENQALGRPATEGATPQLEPRERGVLEGIF